MKATAICTVFAPRHTGCVAARTTALSSMQLMNHDNVV